MPGSKARADADTGADSKPYSDSKPLTQSFSDAIARAFAATADSKSKSAAFAKSHSLRRK
jgi:hypothetical protein